MRWDFIPKALRFRQITAEHQDRPFFTVSNYKTSSQNISKTLLQISLKLHEHRGCYWRKKLPWTIVVHMAKLGGNQSERRKDNGAIVLEGHVSHFHWNVITCVHVTHFDQSEGGKGVAYVDPRPFAVEVTECVCACVNLKLRPRSFAWVVIYSKKQGAG